MGGGGNGVGGGGGGGGSGGGGGGGWWVVMEVVVGGSAAGGSNLGRMVSGGRLWMVVMVILDTRMHATRLTAELCRLDSSVDGKDPLVTLCVRVRLELEHALQRSVAVERGLLSVGVCTQVRGHVVVSGCVHANTGRQNERRLIVHRGYGK
jgi:hypothetical protein